MASALNLCQHFDLDGTICTSNDYALCPHCQLQLCLRHLNFHHEYLRIDCDRLSEDINRLRQSLDQLKFDSSNQAQLYLEQLDQWYQERLESLNRTYREKQQQFRLFYVQAQVEFQKCKSQKERQLKSSLSKQWLKVSQQKQIHVDDLNEMKYKLACIERGLDELKQLLIEFSIDSNTMEIIIVKRRYVEASKTSFHEDDDQFVWDISDQESDHEQESILKTDDNDDEEKLFLSVNDQTVDIAQDSIEKVDFSSNDESSEVEKKNAPLKVIIKRLRHPLRSKKIKYKCQTLSPSSSIHS